MKVIITYVLGSNYEFKFLLTHTGKSSGMRTIQALQDHATGPGEQTTFEEGKVALANQIHMQVQPQQVPVSVIIVDDGFLPSSIKILYQFKGIPSVTSVNKINYVYNSSSYLMEIHFKISLQIEVR